MKRANKWLMGKSHYQLGGLIFGIFIFIIFLLMEVGGSNKPASNMAAVASIMAIWWISEAVPLFVTALLPMVLFPLLGIMKAGSLAPIYVNSTIFLFIGGFLIALAMERWSLHQRIALGIIKAIGGGPARITLGFMVAAAFLSMWISNTATAIMMVPIGLAIIYQLESEFKKEDTHNFSTGLMLGIAYACSVGGIATLVGTPPNLSFSRIFQITFPGAEPVSFGAWFLLGFPLSVILLIVIWLFITKIFFKASGDLKIDHSVIEKEYMQLGKISYEEKVVFTVFILTAILWVFRKPLNMGFVVIPGWSTGLPFESLIDDGTIAVFMALILFLIPSRSSDKKEAVAILDSDVISKLPWDIVLLFGGGFALAKGFQTSGLSDLIGNNFRGLSDTPPIFIILAVCVTITFLTELTSNTATTEMVLPVLASVAVALKVNPILLMVPATIAASQAFMMPVATPPNAIVFGSKRIKISQMAKIGFFINIAGVIVLVSIFYLLGGMVFNMDFHSFPDWAANAKLGK